MEVKNNKNQRCAGAKEEEGEREMG